ncbi:hypothetical protein N658DRAFT_446728 [Parathielavia hyrcaniae]|uniref:DUF1275 domain protein n=1 Tax=Parathielavia hyrcaniae TaxID=113614 RepID=A0AAN6Q3T8_9PEZI|nr:hypothetical protein N658DRAFT_446728 [Parathielavia hyrcaniae]
MANDHGDEQTPLLGHTKPNRKPSRWRRHLMADVSRDRSDLVLLFCYLITGLLDSASISVWGSFVSMQTGNTVYFGLGLASPADSTRWIRSGVSLAFFCLGSLTFSRLHGVPRSPTRRWVLCASFLVQLALTATAAGLVTATGPPAARDETGWQVLMPIALVAFQSAGQAVLSRALQFKTLTSVVLTSIYCDLFSDCDLLALRNAERDRRTAAPLLLLMGAFVGGRFANSSLGVADALWTASVMKAAVVFVWLVWPAGRDSEET